MRKEVIVQKNPKSPISETFRTLRTNIQFMNSKTSLKSLLVTSTLPGEGKSWISANLAVTFAKADKKVVLIDADMRKGRQHLIFGVENQAGLSNLLSAMDENRNTNILRYIQPTEEPNLSIISKGDVPPNPSELLSSEVTIALLAQLTNMFDLVIVDGPPCLIVTDSVLLSRIVDSTVIVAEYHKTKKENLAKIKKDIENVGGKIAGVVINKVPKQGSRYGSYGSTYYYSSEERKLSNIKTKKPKKKSEYNDLASEEETEAPDTNTTNNQQDYIKEQIEEYYKNKEQK